MREVTYVTADDRTETLKYDQLVVSVGSVSRVLDIPGLTEHGLGFKTISEAIALRNSALQNLEIAESLEDPEERRKYLTFVFVGAGYAGVEGIAELQDFVADVIERYPRCRLDGTRFILVEAADRIMPEIPAKLADWTVAELRARGIEVRTGTRLNSLGPDSAELSTGETIPDAHPLLDRRRQAARRSCASWVCRSPRTGASTSTRRCASAVTTTSGRSATARRCQTPPRAAPSRPRRPPSTP